MLAGGAGAQNSMKPTLLGAAPGAQVCLQGVVVRTSQELKSQPNVYGLFAREKHLPPI